MLLPVRRDVIPGCVPVFQAAGHATVSGCKRPLYRMQHQKLRGNICLSAYEVLENTSVSGWWL
jgi:hypothetical protein